MIYIIIYFIGFIISFYICKSTKKEDAKYKYEMYKIKLTNGRWLIESITISLFSWIIIIPYILYYIIKFIFKILGKINIIKNFKIWLNTVVDYDYN